MPKLLKCIKKTQSEPCYKKHSSRAGAMSFLKELRSPALRWTWCAWYSYMVLWC